MRVTPERAVSCAGEESKIFIGIACTMNLKFAESFLPHWSLIRSVEEYNPPLLPAKFIATIAESPPLIIAVEGVTEKFPPPPEKASVAAGREFSKQLRERIAAGENLIVESTLSGNSFLKTIDPGARPAGSGGRGRGHRRASPDRTAARRCSAAQS